MAVSVAKKRKVRGLGSERLREALVGYGFIALPMSFFLLFFIFPIGYAAYISRYDWGIFRGPFVGFDNYRQLYHDSVFWQHAVRNTLVYTAIQAGRAGGFRLVIGVDRDEHAADLTTHGAAIVVTDLVELLSDPTDQRGLPGPRAHRLLAVARRIVAATEDFTPDPWRIVETVYNPAFVEQTETLFALSNDLSASGGSFEEGEPRYHPATLLNGFHETWPIIYPEAGDGFATTGQTIVPVPDGTAMRLFVDDDPLTCERTEVREFERALDMRRAVLDRSVVYQLAGGQRFQVDTRRFVFTRSTPHGVHSLHGDSARRPGASRHLLGALRARPPCQRCCLRSPPGSSAPPTTRCIQTTKRWTTRV